MRTASSRCAPSHITLDLQSRAIRLGHNERSPSSHTCQPYGFLLIWCDECLINTKTINRSHKSSFWTCFIQIIFWHFVFVDLPTHQCITISVSVDEVCHWWRNDQGRPLRCLKSVGKKIYYGKIYDDDIRNYSLFIGQGQQKTNPFSGSGMYCNATRMGGGRGST